MPKVSVNALVVRQPSHRRENAKTPKFDLLRVRHLTGRHKAGRIGVSVGGGQKTDETLAQALRREVEEEVNLTDLRLLSDRIFSYRVRGETTESGARLDDTDVLFVLCTSDGHPTASDEVADPVFCNPAKTFSLYAKERRLDSDMAAFRFFNGQGLMPHGINFRGFHGISWNELPTRWPLQQVQAAA